MLLLDTVGSHIDRASVIFKDLGENDSIETFQPSRSNGCGPDEVDERSALLSEKLKDAMTRGIAVAVASKTAEESLAQKEMEISRLKDKLLYWERMNQEMAQQNSESIGMLWRVMLFIESS